MPTTACSRLLVALTLVMSTVAHAQAPTAPAPATPPAAPAPTAPAPASGPPARVAVELPACPTSPFDARVFGELFALELRADGSERAASAASAVAVLRIEQPACETPRLLLVVEDRATSKTVGRAVDLGPIEPPARPRWLALAAAELLRASWLELVLLRPATDPLGQAVRQRLVRALAGPTPSAAGPTPSGAGLTPSAVGPTPSAVGLTPSAVGLTPSVASPSSPAIAPAIEPVEGMTAFLGASARAYPAWQGGLLGGTVGVQLPWSGPWSWRLDGRVLRGEAFDPLGQVTMWQGSAGVALLAGTAPGPVRLHVGPRVEVGVGRVSGSAGVPLVNSASGSRAVGSAGAHAVLTGAVGPRWRVFAALEPGVTFAGVTARADGRKIGGLAGPYLELTVGVGLRP